MQNNKLKMENEIRLRLESETWNLTIAGNVLRARTIRKEKGIFLGYITSLATASVFLMLFALNVYSYLNSSSYASSQNTLLYSYNSESDAINTEEVDLLINEVFPMR